MSRTRWRGAAAVALALLLAVTACGRESGGSGDRDRSLSEAEVRYGAAPVPDGAVTYQPDVVFIEGGPESIRSASANGLVWTVDGRAKGVSELRAGVVMMASTYAVGRVASLAAVGDDVAVTLAPVGLTDIFRDASFDFEYAIDPDSLLAQEVPELPGRLAEAEPAAGATSHGLFRHAALADVPLPAPSRGLSHTIAVGSDWQASPFIDPSKIGITASYTGSKTLKFVGDVALVAKDMKLRTSFGIENGVMGDNMTFALDGLQAVKVSLSAGAAQGAFDNTKIRIEVPVEKQVQLLVEPVPLRLAFTWTFIVTTAITGNNSTLTADAEWSLKGPLGIENGSLLTPEFAVTKSLMDSISGISIGVSGVVFAMATKVVVGLGVPGFVAGPHAKLTFDVGVTNGSALGASLTRCRSGTVDIGLRVGGGVIFASEIQKALGPILGRFFKKEIGVETSVPIVHREQVIPDVPLCTA